MKRTVWLWQLFGFALTSLLGTILHFLYEWLGKADWIAPFSGINESTWEHMKLIFWPMLLYAIFESFFFKAYESFWCVKLRGILLGQLLIPVIFYTYNGAVGKSPDWFNIAIFFTVAAIVYIYEARRFKSERLCYGSKAITITILCIIALLFILFTFFTPEINIFKDPLTDTYGI
jgi:hypothetical protein